MRVLTFEVEGTPRPQGSKVPIVVRGRARLVESADMKGGKLGKWRRAVMLSAKRALDRREPLYGPVRLLCEFLFDRPKSHFTSKGLIKSGMLHATSRRVGDLSKLVRAVEDAITDAGIWTDDSYVIECHARKRYSDVGELPGVRVTVEEV